MPDDQPLHSAGDLSSPRLTLLDQQLTDFGRPYSRNVRIGTHRTTIRLESEVWDALTEIASRENASINDLCTMVARNASANKLASFTSALRVFIVAYYRTANRLGA